MAAELYNIDSFITPPPALCHQVDPFCPLVGEQGSICSWGSDSGIGSPLTPSEALTSSEEDDDYLAELTLQMANDMLREQNDGGCFTPGSAPSALSNHDMPRWVDLFAVSPQSTLRLPSGLSDYNKKASVQGDESQHENSGAEGNSDKIEPVQTISCHDRNRWSRNLHPGLCSNQTFLNDGNWTKEQSSIRPERAPKQSNSTKRKTHTKNNQWRARSGLVQGEYYVGLSLPKPQKSCQPKSSVSDMKGVLLGDYPNSGIVSTGTGVFLPKASANPTEQGRRPRCSTVLIPARVAQALMVHFSKTRHHQQSVRGVGGGGGGGGDGGCFPLTTSYDIHSSLRCGPGPNFQQEGQADPEPAPVVNCNEMGLPQEWMY